MKYVALLRGINVGGKNIVKMAELKQCLEDKDVENIQTYIQSGNVLFETKLAPRQVEKRIEDAIENTFGFKVPVVVLSKMQLRKVILGTPDHWLEREDWKYNYLFLKNPYDMKQILSDIGPLKPDIEYLTPGDGVIYQALSFSKFGRTTSGKLASMPVYKIITIRNHNTVTKLFERISS